MHIFEREQKYRGAPSDWLPQLRDELSDILHQEGAILFRGFSLGEANDFKDFGSHLVGEWMNYQDRASKRSQVDGPIHTSTDTPPSIPIALHSESSFTSQWPQKILFCCHTPPAKGGRTPIADTRKIYADIEPSLRARFEKLGVMYLRNFSAGIGMDWRDVFQADDAESVNAYCRSAQIHTEWFGSEHLRTIQVRPAVATHPVTKQSVWFNHALALSQYSLTSNLRDTLLRQSGEEELPNNTYFGNGDAISSEEMAHIEEVHTRHTVRFDWAQGDLLLLDNMLMTHGRETFSGKRVIHAALADPLCWSEVNLTIEMPESRPQFEKRELRHIEHTGTASVVPPDGLNLQAWFVATLRDTLDVPIENCDLSFLDSGGDSLVGVDLLDMAIDEFGVEFSIEKLFEADSMASFLQNYAAALKEHSKG